MRGGGAYCIEISGCCDGPRMWLGQGTQGVYRDFGEEVLRNVGLEGGIEDWMMTLGDSSVKAGD